ncbi:MAG: GtrA family protein, partial [Desulfovibrio sp.]|nr:GtrA family protein [Desulfovibrio sp.]
MTADLYRKGLALYERHRDIVSYLFWGVMTTLVNYVAYFVCRLCFGIDYIASNVAAWAVAVAFGFVVNKIYVFRSLDWSAKVAFRECWQFVAARLFSGVLETAILKVFVDWLGMNDAIVKIFSNIVV